MDDLGERVVDACLYGLAEEGGRLSASGRPERRPPRSWEALGHARPVVAVDPQAEQVRVAVEDVAVGPPGLRSREAASQRRMFGAAECLKVGWQLGWLGRRLGLEQRPRTAAGVGAEEEQAG